MGLTTLFLVMFPISGKGHSIRNIPLLLMAIGFFVQLLGFNVFFLDPGSTTGLNVILALTEALVVIALAAAGLSIRTPASWKNWNPAYLLVLGTMPLMTISSTLLAYYILRLDVATSLLLGAVLAPTDPVLARVVQVGGPKDKTKENPLKLALSAESGLNDGFAFPFVYLAIITSIVGASQAFFGFKFLEWLTVDFIVRILLGVFIGIGFGHFGAKLACRIKSDDDHEEFFGLMVLGAIIATYFIAEVLGGYGFLSVFFLTYVARQVTHKQHGAETLILPHAFSDQLEILFTSVSLLWLGTFIAEKVLPFLFFQEVLYAILAVLIIRPITAMLSLMFSTLSRRHKFVASTLGIKGMGSIFYLCYAIKNGEFSNLEGVWRVVAMVIFLSVVLHGFTANYLIDWSQNETKV